MNIYNILLVNVYISYRIGKVRPNHYRHMASERPSPSFVAANIIVPKFTFKNEILVVKLKFYG